MGVKLSIKDKKFYLGDEEFYLISGDIHYFRIHESDWRKRLELMKDFGLTAIQVYSPWNLHNPKPNEFDFSGILDLGKFIDIADELGLKVLLRPAPYICSECDFGGMPSWVAQERDTLVRSLDPRFIDAVDAYYKEIFKIIVPRLSTNGGPIIALAIDNEYGNVSVDKPYLEKIAELMTKYGCDVPYYITDGGSSPQTLYNGTTNSALFEGLNFRSNVESLELAKKAYDTMFPDKPFFIGELWAGRAIYWDEPFKYRDPKETADCFKAALEMGAYVNFYMFAGGTNFGPFSGGIVGWSYSHRPNTPSRYMAHTTSYDEDALINENGVPTEKYYLCRDILDEYLGKPKRERVPYEYEAQKILNVQLDEAADMFENLDVLTDIEVDAIAPKYMEDIGQDYGFLLYSSHVPHYGTDIYARFRVNKISDRATIYLDKKYKGEILRDREVKSVYHTLTEKGVDVDILVENMARITTGEGLNYERKGIIGDVRFWHPRIVNWKHRAITLKDISGLNYKPITDEIPDDMPIFLKGKFDAKPGVDSFVHTAGFTKGYIWVNGYNLGRYWCVGPQMTLYVPGAILKEKDNVVEIFDVNPKNNPRKIDFIDRNLLEMD